MSLEKSLGLAGVILGIAAIAFGALLTTQASSSSPATQTLLNLTGQNLSDGSDTTFSVPLVFRTNAIVTISLQSSGPVGLSVSDANGPLAAGVGQTSYTRTLTLSHDTIARITVSNPGLSPVTFTLSAVENYTPVDLYAGYLGLAAGVGLLLLGLAFLQRRSQLGVASK